MRTKAKVAAVTRPTPKKTALASSPPVFWRTSPKALVAWSSTIALLFLATLQPSAYGLEFAASTQIFLPGSASLNSSPEATPLAYGHLQSAVTISANELALVSTASVKVEMARTSKGAQRIAQEIISKKYGWSERQFACLKTLWTRESHWNYRAHNRRSGAHGIAQALPAVKMEIMGTDWRTNPVTQIRWGLHYIDVRYSTPCRALAKFSRSRYY